MPAVEAELPVVIHRDFAEEINHHQQVFEVEIPLAHLNQQVVGAVTVETVAAFLIAPLPVFFRYFLRVQDTAKRVVPAAGIGNYACQNAAHIGVKTVPGGEPRRMLTFQRIGQVQTLAFVMWIKHQQADVCPAVDIRHTQDLPALEHKREMPAAR